MTRKITRSVARIKLELDDYLYLGNLDARRDWGYAPEYVEGMWRIVQLGEGDDFVLATGETHTVREFVEAAFGAAGLEWQKYVVVDEAYMRPAEVDQLRGDASKARKKLGWKPETTFEQLVHEMLEHDLMLEGVDPAKHLRKPPAGVTKD